jgi:hypothetical protein
MVQMKKKDVDIFEKLIGQLDSLHSEIGMLAKKSPNDAVNSFKLKFVNSTLDQSNNFLGEKYRPFSDFERFSEDDMPSTSDVTFIISQYIECGEKFRADNIMQYHGLWWWDIDGEESGGPSMRAAPPKKISK